MSSTQNLDGLLKWRCVGPFRGGRIVAVSGSYDDPSTFYFGAVAGGIWKTTDAGSYWTPISDGFLNTSSIGALAVAPSDSNVIYAGTGETTIRIDVTHGDGIYKSTDAGKTWSHIGLEDTRFIGKVRVHPDNPDIVYVAALGHAFGPNKERGVYKSVDGGKNWTQTLFVSDKAGAVDLTLDAKPRIIYATIWEAHRKFWDISSGGEDSGIWRSTDGGETWQGCNEKLLEFTKQDKFKSRIVSDTETEGMMDSHALAISSARPGTVFLANRMGLFRSPDRGDSWEEMGIGRFSPLTYARGVRVSPHDPKTMYAALSVAAIASIRGAARCAHAARPARSTSKARLAQGLASPTRARPITAPARAGGSAGLRTRLSSSAPMS